MFFNPFPINCQFFKLSYATREARCVKLNEVELLAKLISKAVQKIYFVRMFVC